jgi:hypothetical protein
MIGQDSKPITDFKIPKIDLGEVLNLSMLLGQGHYG